MGRVKPTAKANLNNRCGDLFLAERFKDGADEDLKLSRWPDARLNLIGGIKGACDRLGERECCEWLAIDLYPLAIADQVRFRRGGVSNARSTEGR
jgi:hypothetical protein